MLALAELFTAGKRKYTAELIGYQAAGIMCVKLVLGLPVTPGKRALKQILLKADGLLRGARVKEICFKNDFPYKQCFLELGYVEPCRDALLSAKAGEIAFRATQSHESALISAPGLKRGVLWAADFFSTRFRYLAADLPAPDWDVLCARVEATGLSPKHLGAMGESDADAAIFFGEPQKRVFLPCNCSVLFVGGKRPLTVAGGREIRSVHFSLPDRMKEDFPPGYPADVLLSRAIEAGTVQPSDVTVI